MTESATGPAVASRHGAASGLDTVQFAPVCATLNTQPWNRDKFYMSNRNRERGEMGLGRKDQKIAAPLPRSESRESNAAPPFEYRHATTTTRTTHMNCQLQGGCESREQRVELGEGRG